MRRLVLALVLTALVVPALPAGTADGDHGALVLSNVVYEYIAPIDENWGGPVGSDCGQFGLCSPAKPRGVFTFTVTNEVGENVTGLGASFTLRAGISATQSVQGLGEVENGKSVNLKAEPGVYPAPQFCVRVSGKTEVSKHTVYSNEVCVTLSRVAGLP